MAIEHLSDKFTVRELRERAGYTRTAFADLTKLSYKTIVKIEQGLPVSAPTAYRVLNVLNDLLGMSLPLEEVEGLTISQDKS